MSYWYVKFSCNSNHFCHFWACFYCLISLLVMDHTKCFPPCSQSLKLGLTLGIPHSWANWLSCLLVKRLEISSQWQFIDLKTDLMLGHSLFSYERGCLQMPVFSEYINTTFKLWLFWGLHGIRNVFCEDSPVYLVRTSVSHSAMWSLSSLLSLMFSCSCCFSVNVLCHIFVEPSAVHMQHHVRPTTGGDFYA